MKIDLLSAASFRDGHPLQQYRWLRDNCPVYWHPEPNGAGFWAVTRYADVRAVNRDFVTYSSEPTITIEDLAPEAKDFFGDHKMLLMMDPPQHAAYRRLIRQVFTQSAAQLLAPRLNRIAIELVDGVIEDGHCDFVEAIAGPMASYVIADLIGIPREDACELYRLTEIMHGASGTTQAAKTGAAMAMFAYGHKVIAEKRIRPCNDLATQLLNVELDGRRLDDLEFLLFFLLLVDAGGDTTRNTLGAGLIALLAHPQELHYLLCGLTSRLAAAREELLRYTSPIVHMRRTAKRDTVLAGIHITEGDKVVIYFGSANRDPMQFSCPDELRLTRNPDGHIAFGIGPHGCLGQYVARIEMDAIFSNVLTRMRGIEITGGVEWLGSNFVCGPKTLPVRFTAARRRDQPGRIC